MLIRVPLSDCDSNLVLVDVDGQRLNLADVVRQLQESHSISLYMSEGDVAADRIDQKHATEFFWAALLQSDCLSPVEAERVLVAEMLGVILDRYFVEDSFRVLNEQHVVLHELVWLAWVIAGWDDLGERHTIFINLRFVFEWDDLLSRDQLI